MKILNLPYSFMQFAPISKTHYILPIYQEDDVWFAVLVRGDTFEEAQDIFFANDNEMHLLLLRGYDNNPASIVPQTIRNYATNDNLLFDKYKVSENDILFVWKHDLKKVIVNDPIIECNECFQLGITFRGQKLVSNPLRKICNDIDTSVVQYSSEEDSFQFYYCRSGHQNKVRVPMILRQPQIITDETIYVRSNGTRKVTKSAKTKEYKSLVDFTFIELHERLDIALSHDFVSVKSRDFTGGIVKTGNYEIDWEGAINHDLAQGECKVLVTPFYAKNSNCAGCVDCGPLSIDSNILPDALEANVYYDVLVPITGNGPFFLSDINKPDWIDIVEVLNNDIRIAGTIPQESKSDPISFKIYNCYGENNFEFTSFINVIYVAPPNVTVQNITSTSASFTWAAISGASSYEINLEELVNPTQSNLKIMINGYPKTITNTSDVCNTLTSNGHYIVSVRTKSVFGTSTWTIKSFTTL